MGQMGYRHSGEAKAKISKVNKGRISWRKGRTNIDSKETLKKRNDNCQRKKLHAT